MDSLTRDRVIMILYDRALRQKVKRCIGSTSNSQISLQEALHLSYLLFISRKYVAGREAEGFPNSGILTK